MCSVDVQDSKCNLEFGLRKVFICVFKIQYYVNSASSLIGLADKWIDSRQN